MAVRTAGRISGPLAMETPVSSAASLLGPFVAKMGAASLYFPRDHHEMPPPLRPAHFGCCRNLAISDGCPVAACPEQAGGRKRRAGRQDSGVDPRPALPPRPLGN